MSVNETQIALRRRTSTHTTLDQFLDCVRVQYAQPNESQVVSVSSNAQHALITSTMVSGNIAVGTSSTFPSTTYFASLLSTAVGTAATTSSVDVNGSYLNRVVVRNAATHERLLTSGGFEIFGLIQCGSATVDLAAIGASGSENLQISFAYIDGAGVLTLTPISTTVAVSVEFGMRPARRFRNMATIESVGDPLGRPQVAQSGSASINQRLLTVTTAFLANEVITLSTGGGATAGVSTIPGSGHGADSISTLGTTAAIFNANDQITVYLNGVVQIKGTDVVYGSSGTLYFTQALYVNDQVLIRETV